MDPSGLIYARISQVYGETDDSLDNQVDTAEKAAVAMAVPVGYTFRERDSGHETADSRVDLLQARQLVRSRKVTHFFIHNFDRLSRTPEELVSLWKECLQYGVKVVCCMWPQFHDLDLETAKFLLRMLGMVGEFEWSFIRARTTQNKQQIRDKGLVVGEGGPRFGFTWDRETRSRRPSEEPHPVFGVSSAQVVRTIFELIGLHGYSLRRTARELNGRGWPTPSIFRGKKFKDGRRPGWTNDGVRLIVTDEQYKGVVHCSRSEAVGKRRSRKKPREQWVALADARTEPLVSPELWEKANHNCRENDVVGRRTRAKRSAAETRNEDNFALFRGIISCGCCRRPLRPVWSRSWNPATKDHTGPRVRLYRCDSSVDAYERGLAERCRGKAVYEDKVKAAVWARVVKVATDEGLVLAEAERLKSERLGEALHRESHKAASAEAEACDRRVKNLVAGLAETDDAEDRAMIRAAIDQEKKAREGHRRRADRLAKQLAAYDQLDRRAEEMVERCRQLRGSSPAPLEMPDSEKRHWLEWLGVTLKGNARALTVRFDMGLVETVEAAAEPLEELRGTT
jgi:DNA invertase Pin-like site-specific DNA recombinase